MGRRLRALGNELARRSAVWPDPHLYIWGWQSPLHFYGKLDGVTRHFFVDNLLRDQAERDHPLIKPRIAEIMRSLREPAPCPHLRRATRRFPSFGRFSSSVMSRRGWCPV